MKIQRSSKCTLKFLTDSKKAELLQILEEYKRTTNLFIDSFWTQDLERKDLTKENYSCDSWLSARLLQCSARQALDMVSSSKKLGGEKPKLQKPSMRISSQIVQVSTSKTNTFDLWVVLTSIGNKIKLQIPLKKHRQFNILEQSGKMLKSYVITEKYIQFVFEIETGKKLEPSKTRGIDTGIHALASTSDGKQFGTDIKEIIHKLKRKKYGSKAYKRTSKYFQQRIGEIAKETINGCNAIIVENLKNITKNTKNPKRRLGKNIRRSLGKWQYGYWLERLEQLCEWNRVTFRKVSPFYTSQTCYSCGHIERQNRKNDKFLCLKCGHTDNADVNAAKNIVLRYCTGKYGSGFQPLL